GCLSNFCLILGQGRLVRELRQKFERHPEMLCRVVGILCPEDGRAEAESLPGAQPPISTALPGIEDLLCSEGVEELLVALPGCGSRQLLSLAGRCRQRGIRVSLVPELYELYLSRPHLVDLDGLPVLHLGEPGKPGRRAWKRGFDLVFASILAIFAFPVVLFAALLLRRGRARGFRWEARCGYQGRTFSMLRLNVDRGEAKSFWERLLQELSLTELPQLWNVLRGDMSLVGPRPESPDRVRRYSEWQQQRLTVKPGMTGLAQVHGLREQHSSEEKTRYDLQYVLSVSPWADLSLLLQTLWTLATRPWNRRKAAAADSVMRPMSDLRLNPEFHREMADHAHRP
ncbi:MAG TPA: sugar transferase, partial [Terriglobales bacterium]|nr:sugar transferase [Terriglobales bacterium]